MDLIKPSTTVDTVAARENAAHDQMEAVTSVGFSVLRGGTS
jgi:hypothetical protein